ncbi:Hypothetical predicted protein [Mytilus galloprovincialis]|uniref:Uncharacterized protein n=1 Tax=Mytilus galloprovincialis TaxID=29158 RepID=A0A8B6EDE1_MYTGA|nr:Hypothetical predicted protein [Mytilus galloprovincialis]
MSQNRKYWDIFRKDVSKVKLEKKSSISDNIFKGLKIIMYIILSLIVFGGAIVSRASLQILTDKLYLESRTNYTVNLEKDAISYYLLCIISIPDGFKLILSLLQFLFGKRDSPSLIQFIVIIIKECVHCFCLGTLVFKVLPLLNAVEVCAYLSGTPIVPSILKSLPKSKGRLSKGVKRKCKKLLNIISIILQAGAVFVVPIYKVTFNQISYTETFLMVLCSICVSVRWFETHFEHLAKLYEKLDDENGEQCKEVTSLDDENGEQCKEVTSLVTSFLRLVMALTLFFTFYSPGVASPWETFSPRSLSNSSKTVAPCSELLNSTTVQLYNMTIRPCDIPSSGYHGDDWLLNSFLIHFFTSMGLFYGAVISTRLGMDKICFCITLAIGTPVYLIALVVSKLTYETNWISRTLMSKEVNVTEIWIMIIMFCIAWASQLWTCKYIWYSSHDRMALVSRLFVLPHYCSPIADLSLLHSRRHKRIHDDRQRDASDVTKVYICATMWHENRREMKQFIKTLFR